MWHEKQQREKKGARKGQEGWPTFQDSVKLNKGVERLGKPLGYV